MTWHRMVFFDVVAVVVFVFVRLNEPRARLALAVISAPLWTCQTPSSAINSIQNVFDIIANGLANQSILFAISRAIGSRKLMCSLQRWARWSSLKSLMLPICDHRRTDTHWQYPRGAQFFWTKHIHHTIGIMNVRFSSASTKCFIQYSHSRFHGHIVVDGMICAGSSTPHTIHTQSSNHYSGLQKARGEAGLRTWFDASPLVPDDDQVAKENCNHNIKFNGTSISLSFERRALCSLSPRNRISIHLVIDVVNDACRQSQDFQLFHERTNEKKIIEHLKYRNVCCYCCCCASASYVFFTHHQIIRFSIDLLSARDKKKYQLCQEYDAEIT